MPGDIRDHAILQSTSTRLEELIAACRRGGKFHGHYPNLDADVVRKALRTSLTGLVVKRVGACNRCNGL